MESRAVREELELLVPDYYRDFACKMGGCRSACCAGWPISISMQNYYYLLGIDCKKHLRDRLDLGLRIAEHPTEEAYAHIEQGYDGDCRLRMADGRCALHAELGEDKLPDVCRLYPRGIRMADGIYECSCANSCEAVPELLLAKREHISFSFERLRLKLPPMTERSSFFETLGEERRVRSYLISVLQADGMTLPQRLICLGDVLGRMELAFEQKDRALLDRIVSEKPMIDIERYNRAEVEAEHLQFGLRTVERMISVLDDKSKSIRACGEAALAYFGDDEGGVERYRRKRADFEELIPNWELFYENLLVNHMFFSQFPFQDRPESIISEYIALCAVYVILRFIGIGSMAEGRDISALIDGTASIFRLVEHTEFDRYAAHLLKSSGCTSKEQLYSLLSL